ncbi:methyl-accepting chemotaxis protein [Paenibacillus macerans]|uniref:methyl-accepting chemotaxis protein n=1 Tax=Paenibacillus macerans TaxID=44252 RepID=UPI00203E7B5E|nr:methyl-accepting chemotaxis protein [Paenibacillus macerans]MCM3703720.1 methyl-accepting chemotaxis protein [Paenibacillus macerans]
MKRKVKGKAAGGFVPALSLGRKLTATFFTISLLVGAIAGLAYVFMDKLNRNYSAVLEQNTAAIERVSRLESDAQRQNSLLFDYIMEPLPEKEQQITEVNKQLGDLIGTVESAYQGGGGADIAKKLAESNSTFARLLTKVRDYVNEGKPDLAKAEALVWSIPVSDALIQGAEQLRTLQQTELERTLNGYRREADEAVRTLAACGIAVLLLSVATGIVVSRIILKPMRAMLKGAKDMAAGDLTMGELTVNNRDELGDLASAFNGMKASWHAMISELRRNAGKVADSAEQLRRQSVQFRLSSEEISGIMGEISAGSEEQVQSVERGVSQVAQMSSGVSGIAGLAEEAKRQSSQALRETLDGERIVASAVSQMDTIQHKMTDLHAFIEQLGVHSGQIGEAAELIAGISKQTQMLALNASIEAARAGEAGKGFAVVASEVRKLSEQTGVAATGVAELVEGIHGEMQRVMEAARSGSREVAAGLDTVGEAGQAFSSIRQAVEQVTGQITRVSEQAERLLEQSDSVVEAITSINRVAQQTAGGAREVYAHTEEQHAGAQEMLAAMDGLSQLSEELRTMIGKFKVSNENS